MAPDIAASLRADDAPHRKGGRRHIQNEELFRRLLIRERKRADRLNQPLVVLMLAAGDLRGPDAAVIWRGAIEAVAQTRETDVVGWLDHHSRIGIILYDVPALDTVYARELEVRIRQELARRFSPDIVARFSIALHVHSSAPHTQCDPDVTPNTRVIEDAIKRVFDILGSAALLLLLLPLLAVIAALVKLKSPGPILFRQVRIGRDMKPFAMLKFRTMHVNADPGLHRAFVSEFITASTTTTQTKDGPALFKLVADPRITPIGSVLRKTSIDELPQLWNVLRGEMSLVGPRPPLPYEVEQYRPWHTRRVVEAKPGITGLWQVGGRSRTTFDDMVRLDLRYAKGRSFWTDMKILLATPGAVFSGKGAC